MKDGQLSPKDGDGIILQLKKLSALLHKKNSNHEGYSYCLNCLGSLRTENKHKVCENKDGIKMPSEKNKIL